mmetsp:Transcript_21251/g.54212  ORF Transcript_21251/g.54212 Transcript_21251/m.54212 type:complete len:238 (+) Transcript_21251:266-979(+)
MEMASPQLLARRLKDKAEQSDQPFQLLVSSSLLESTFAIPPLLPPLGGNQKRHCRPIVLEHQAHLSRAERPGSRIVVLGVVVGELNSVADFESNNLLSRWRGTETCRAQVKVTEHTTHHGLAICYSAAALVASVVSGPRLLGARAQGVVSGAADGLLAHVNSSEALRAQVKIALPTPEHGQAVRNVTLALVADVIRARPGISGVELQSVACRTSPCLLALLSRVRVRFTRLGNQLLP